MVKVETSEISLLRLRRILEKVKNAQPVTIKARTQPRLVGVHPWRSLGTVFKVAVVNGIISWQYTAAVNRQRTREGKRPNFEALERAWGERLPNSPLVEYNGNFYLELKVERSISYKSFATLKNLAKRLRRLTAHSVRGWATPRKRPMLYR